MQEQKKPAYKAGFFVFGICGNAPGMMIPPDSNLSSTKFE